LPKSGSEPPAPVQPKRSSKPRQPKAADVKPLAQAEEPGYAQEIPVQAEVISQIRPRPYARLRKGRRQFKSKILNPPTPVIEQREINMETKRIVEAILFAAKRPMTAKHVQQVFPELEQPELQDIQAAIDAVMEDYQQRPIELKKLASGYRFQVKSELSRWVSRLFEEKPPKYSRALLETLAIIAYRQPVTRGEIEDIRGVSVSSSIIQTLLEREWVRVVAHKEVPGRPGLYGTTKQFLDYFNITAISELPTLQEIQHLDLSTDYTHQQPQVTSETQQTIEQQTETSASE